MENASNKKTRNRPVYRHVNSLDTLLSMSMPVTESGCWIWLGSTTKSGYGRICIDRKDHLAHRFALSVSGGNVSKSDLVMHKCDNPICVNPEHLQIGTQCDNMKDMARKGRSSKGAMRYNAKLNESIVKYIRDSGEHPKILAAQLNVSRELVRDVKANKRWRHVA